MGPSMVLLTAALVLAARPTSAVINCYQCSSTDHEDPYTCNELFNVDGDPDGFLPPVKPCDQVHGASYCIKQTGRFEDIKCVQCATPNCSALFLPTTCNIFEASYCVKSVGSFGGYGTKRFCSALDLGNYCNFVRQPGDDMEYRSCVYTCSGDGCNPASRTVVLAPLLLVLSLLAAIVWHH